MHKGKLTNINPPRITTEPLIWLSLKTWLLYWSESYKHLHCSGKFHTKKGFLQCFQDKGGSHAHVRVGPGSGNH